VLEAALAGHRDEMLEVVIDPLRLEAYNVTAGELINGRGQQQPADRGGRGRDRRAPSRSRSRRPSAIRATSTACR
jgi:hypothetical protein